MSQLFSDTRLLERLLERLFKKSLTSFSIRLVKRRWMFELDELMIIVKFGFNVLISIISYMLDAN